MVAFPTCCVLHLATSGSQKNLRIGAQCLPLTSGDPETTALQGLGTRSAQRGQHRPLLSALLLCLYPSWKRARNQLDHTHLSGMSVLFSHIFRIFSPKVYCRSSVTDVFHSSQGKVCGGCFLEAVFYPGSLGSFLPVNLMWIRKTLSCVHCKENV